MSTPASVVERAVGYRGFVPGTICIDFDDTVVTRDIAGQILERFAGDGWPALRERRRAGELTLEQYSAAALDLVDASEETLVAFALEAAEPREGLADLLDWAHWNGWHAAIVSNGWDLYIDPILRRMGVDRLARHCGRARFVYRWQLRYLSPRGIEVNDGFKLGYAAEFKALGDRLVWVGDGPSDIAPAQASDLVFARDTLLETLGGRDQVHAFEHFGDVVAMLEREQREWRRSSSSTTAAEA
jgi:2-hydroxy-3-keto-5-methylthiopentenyl-1-phosphate phosphatase